MKHMKRLFLNLTAVALLMSVAGCEKSADHRYCENDFVGYWNLKYVDTSEDEGVTWSRYKSAPLFLVLTADGGGEYGDSSGDPCYRADDVVWSLRNDSLFYHSPKWKSMDGTTEAAIVKCDGDTLIFEEGAKSRFVYIKKK